MLILQGPPAFTPARLARKLERLQRACSGISAVSARFDVRNIPTLLVMHRGREVDRIVGAVPKSEILKRLAPLLAA